MAKYIDPQELCDSEYLQSLGVYVVFRNWVEDGIREYAVYLHRYIDDSIAGTLVAHQSEAGFQVQEASCSIKGIGKLLYYHFLDYIYPARLSPDYFTSGDAERVWAVLLDKFSVEGFHNTVQFRFMDYDGERLFN